jgi:hypothetical protein
LQKHEDHINKPGAHAQSLLGLPGISKSIKLARGPVARWNLKGLMLDTGYWMLDKLMVGAASSRNAF